METLSFTFGILTMVTIIIVVAAVIGVVKVVKQQAQLEQLQKDIEWINNRFDNERRDLETLINNVATSADSRFEVIGRFTDTRFENVHSYVDSRIDKLSGTLGAKQLIKG
jgi:uncharacterized membrane protein YfhO